MPIRTDPIVVIGMHRSGTEFLSSVLSERGVFMGAKLDKHGEAKLFQRCNNWMLEKHGARWDAPEAFDYVVQNSHLRRELAAYVVARLRGPRLLAYFGPDRILRGWKGLGAWGWKDPRTTLTLPIWFEAMKNLRAIHIVRHGVDVAQSLHIREHKNFALLLAHHDRMLRSPLRNLYTIYEKRSGFALSPRSLDLEGCFSLWESYVTRARSLGEYLGKRLLSIRYEDLLEDPKSHLERVLDFCELDFDTRVVDRSVARMDATRVYAYRNSPELQTFARSVESRLERLGYPRA